MNIKTATHKKSGKKVEFMHYTKGNYGNVLDWYEQDIKEKARAVYGREDILAGEGFCYYTQEGKLERLNTDWYLVKWGQGDYVHVDPRDFKKWYEVAEEA